MSILNKNIKFYRLQESMTQEKLAERLGLDRTTIVKYESGEHEPSIQTLIELANIFDITLDELVGREP